VEATRRGKARLRIDVIVVVPRDTVFEFTRLFALTLALLLGTLFLSVLRLQCGSGGESSLLFDPRRMPSKQTRIAFLVAV
jgi:hypothetical protein